MAKLTLSNVANISGAESAAIGVINANSDAIETALENTLSRDGTAPNSMAADLDMGNNDILNVDNIDVNTITIDGAPISPSERWIDTLYAGIQFDTVSELLSDTTLTYTLGQAGTVIAGDIVFTREYGLSYRVESLVFVGLHVENSNGTPVRLSPLDDAEGRLNVWALGVEPGATDCTALIQSALDAHDRVYVPGGDYVSSAMFEVRDYCLFEGAGKYQTIFTNNTSDGVGRKPTASTQQWFTVRGIGFERSFNSASRTKAFNFTDCSFHNVSDIYAKNFYVGVYWTQKLVASGGSDTCWYNNFSDFVIRECAFSIWIDNTQLLGADATLSVNSTNGIHCSNGIIGTGNYQWNSAGFVTGGIRYHGYGHTFTRMYIQGASHHIWRDQVGGNNTLSHVYIESSVIPGEMLYAPLEYSGNQDWVENIHIDPVGPDQYSAVYDPQGVFVWRGERNTKPVVVGAFLSGEERVLNGGFDTDTSDWTAQGATPSSVAGGFIGNCLRIQRDTAAAAYEYQILKLEPYRRHRFTIYQKNGTSIGRVYLGNSLIGGEYLTVVTMNNAGWTAYTVDFTPTQKSVYCTVVVNGATGTYVDYDSISCVPLALTVNGDEHVSGNQSVAGNSAIAGNETVGGTLTVTGASTVGGTLTTTGNFSTSGVINVQGNQVVGPRDTGWTAGTGTQLKGAFATYAGATHTGAYVQATVQALDDAAKNASQRVLAIEAVLRTHGLIN